MMAAADRNANVLAPAASFPEDILRVIGEQVANMERLAMVFVEDRRILTDCHCGCKLSKLESRVLFWMTRSPRDPPYKVQIWELEPRSADASSKRRPRLLMHCRTAELLARAMSYLVDMNRPDEESSWLGALYFQGFDGLVMAPDSSFGDTLDPTWASSAAMRIDCEELETKELIDLVTDCVATA
jgi:hypothetical protein